MSTPAKVNPLVDRHEANQVEPERVRAARASQREQPDLAPRRREENQ